MAAQLIFKARKCSTLSDNKNRNDIGRDAYHLEGKFSFTVCITLQVYVLLRDSNISTRHPVASPLRT